MSSPGTSTSHTNQVLGAGNNTAINATTTDASITEATIDPSNAFDLTALAEAVEHTAKPKHQIPVTMVNFMAFPPEVREKIIDCYLLSIVKDRSIKKAIHYDNFGHECCVWDWPNELIVCDKHTEATLPHTMFPKWLPNLALTCHQMRGEVTVHMLKKTNMVTLKFDKDRPVKIAPWMGKFLATFPQNEGFNAIKDLNFPHIHWYNSLGNVPSDRSNEDVDLMIKCPNLARVGLTFHALRINKHGAPLTLEEFLGTFKLAPMLECKSLKHVYIGGIIYRGLYVMGDGQLITLRVFGKWLREQFAKRGQAVTVHLHPRIRPFYGWVNGEAL